eukprot:6576913-Alexandrium_andersonii.AAC.1
MPAENRQLVPLPLQTLAAGRGSCGAGPSRLPAAWQGNAQCGNGTSRCTDHGGNVACLLYTSPSPRD